MTGNSEDNVPTTSPSSRIPGERSRHSGTPQCRAVGDRLRQIAPPSLGPAGGCSRATRRSPTKKDPLQVALEVLRYLKIFIASGRWSPVRGHKHRRHRRIIVSVNGCKSTAGALSSTS